MITRRAWLIVTALIAFFLLGVEINSALNSRLLSPECAHQSSTTNKGQDKDTDKVCAERSEDRLVDLTVWLDLFTGTLAVGTIWLAVGTQALVGGAEKTAERQLRAYVGTKGNPPEIQIKTIKGKATKILKARIDAINHGQTPAYKICYGFDSKIPQNSPERGWAINDGIDTSNVIMPGQKRELWVEVLLEGSDETRLREGGEGGIEINIWGYINYEDAFKEIRFTNFRYKIDARSLRDERMIVSAAGNEAS